METVPQAVCENNSCICVAVWEPCKTVLLCLDKLDPDSVGVLDEGNFAGT
jgi:hypothetical protein